MADPRQQSPQVRKVNLSPLMRAKQSANQGEVVNFCPFNCEQHQLDEHGYCAHLVGFTSDDKKRVYEPRIRRKSDNRIITDGFHPEKLHRGDQLVKITSTFRVYRREPNPDLLPLDGESGGENPEFLDPEEVELRARIAQLTAPLEEGEWGGKTAYDDDEELEPAARPGKK